MSLKLAIRNYSRRLFRSIYKEQRKAKEKKNQYFQNNNIEKLKIVSME